MKNKLKYLYKYLIENNRHEVEGWHKTYSEFYHEIAKIRERIKSGASLSTDDEPFLRKLLFERDNGIAARGQSVLSNVNFQELIRNVAFMRSLERFILNPYEGNFHNFEEAWLTHCKTKNPVLVNRVAAACTLEVSTTIDARKFNEVYNWLIDEKIITHYSSRYNQDWYAKNNYLLRNFKKIFEDKLKENKADEFYLSLFVWKLYEYLNNPFSLKKQIVKYGTPGTGKTYKSRQESKLKFDLWKEEFAPNSYFNIEDHIELVQFHSSYSYEDFMEGLRPVLDSNGEAQLTLLNGVFKDFCIEAGKWEIDVFELGLNKNWDSITIGDLQSNRDYLSGKHWQHIFKITDTSKLLSEAVPPYFFIIDEINRAELSRVFGELMYCLEYRGIEGRVKTQYTKLNNSETGMLLVNEGYQFFIPHNLYMIGTMNTIDRSVEIFDFALRRRFRWEEVTPDTELLKYHLLKPWVKLADNLENLNKKIRDEPLLGSDYQIGHAYLMNLNYSKNLTVNEVRKYVWDDCIRPLLQEYLRGSGKEAHLIGSFGKEFGVK